MMRLHRLRSWWRPPVHLAPWSALWEIAAPPPPVSWATPPPSLTEARALKIVAHIDGPQDLAAMEFLIQSLALSGTRRSRAIALELVGREQERILIVRSANPAMLEYLAGQIYARYPQSRVSVLPLREDPFCLHDGDRVVARELRPTGAPFMSLRTWNPQLVSRHEHQVGVDPLLGILATLGPFPPGMRVIAQLALAPASPTWSSGQQRQADQYSLAHARQTAATRERAGHTPSAGGMAPLFILFLLLVAGGWLMQSATHTLHLPLIGPFLQPVQHQIQRGRTPHAAIPGILLHLVPPLLPVVALVGGIFLATAVLVSRLRAGNTLRRPVYDPQDVALKTKQPGFHARLRLFAIAGPATPNELMQQALDQVVASYRQYHLAGAKVFAERRILAWWASRLVPEAPFWEGDSLHRASHWTWGVPHSPAILSLSEAAALWHLPEPYDQSEVPWMDHAITAKTFLAPRAVQAGADASLILGTSSHAGHVAQVTLTWETLRRHTLAIAKTGKGKSTLLLALARLALHAAAPLSATAGAANLPCTVVGGSTSSPSAGLILIDPHGDLAAALLGCLPPERHTEVVVVDLADEQHPVAFNPLDVQLGRNRDKAVENLLAVFAGIWEKGWGPRMSNALGLALKTLYAANEVMVNVLHEDPGKQYTLLDVEPILTNDQFRRTILTQYLPADQSLHAWWQGYYDALHWRQRQEIINPVLTKMAQFSQSVVARRIVGQPHTALDLTAVVREGKILILHIAKNVIGAETARLIGATLLGALRVTLEEQAILDPAARRRVLVLVDEFQALPGVDYGSMLAELRKFGASFALATQALAYLDRLSPELRATVMANIDNLFCFAMSSDDARIMERELDGVVTVRDLVNVPNYTCYAKVTVQGQRLPVFTLCLAEPPVGDTAQAAALRAASQQVLAKQDAAAVDALLAQLAARHLSPVPVKPSKNVPIGTTAPTPPRRKGLLPDIAGGGTAIPSGTFVANVAAPGKRGRRGGRHHAASP